MFYFTIRPFSRKSIRFSIFEIICLQLLSQVRMFIQVLETYNNIFSFTYKNILKNKTYLFLLKKIRPKLNPFFSKKSLFNKFFKPIPENKEASIGEVHQQANYFISLIEDPLWKSICTEMADMMGPSAVLKICDSRLGSFSHHHKTMDLYCQTEEIAQFTRQYSFVILGSLQRYFPTVKDLQIKINSSS